MEPRRESNSFIGVGGADAAGAAAVDAQNGI